MKPLLSVVLLFGGTSFSFAQEARLELKPGDRVCFIGDAHAERGAAFEIWEALLRWRNVDLKLAVRNLTSSGATPALINGEFAKAESRPPAANIKNIASSLHEEKADVVLIFIGMTDSYHGKSGLAAFVADVRLLIDHCRAAKFNGASPPRLAIVGSIAHEFHGGEFADPDGHNHALSVYNAALRKLASDNALPFVDLFNPTSKLVGDERASRLTVDGLHLSDYGQWAVGQVLMDGLFKKSDARSLPPPLGAKVHAALLGPLPAIDDRNWTLADLADSLPRLESDRSFERGKDLFAYRTCQQCHAVRGDATNLGPGLAAIAKKIADKRMTAESLVTEIVEPSKVIEPKYRVWRFLLDSGRAIDGLIVEEKADATIVAKNPAEPAVAIPMATVEEKVELKQSLMPEGLLARMNREDILDLLAYILAGGEANHPVYRRKE